MPGFFDCLKDPPVIMGEPYPLFTRVSIETTSTCTRKCWFCPVDQRKEQRVVPMTETLYGKICEELHALNFDGVIQWFYINEPFLDKKIVEHIKQLRMAAPLCCIHITSNGDIFRGLIRQGKIDQVIARLSEVYDAGATIINLNAYDQEAVQPFEEIVQRMVAEYPKMRRTDSMWKRFGSGAKRISTADRVNPTGLHSWGMDKIKDHKDVIQRIATQRCARPMRHIVIPYDGKVVLCCAVNPAAEGIDIFGDINNQSMVDVWNSKRFHEYRWELQNGRRTDNCTDCVESAAFPHVHRFVEDPRKSSINQAGGGKGDHHEQKSIHYRAGSFARLLGR